MADQYIWRTTSPSPTPTPTGDGVGDVWVNGVSVVVDKIAYIDLSSYVTAGSLSAVATSGSYADLTDAPTEATSTKAGLLSASDKEKLDKYLHPTVEIQDSDDGVTVDFGDAFVIVSD